MRDMATTGKTPAATARPKRATTKKPPKFAPRADGEPTAEEIKAARVAMALANPERSLIDLYRPTPSAQRWIANLRYLIAVGAMPTEAIQARTKLGRSTIYAWMQGRRGDRPSQKSLDMLAKEFGVPIESWRWELSRLKAWLEAEYPEYAYRFDGTSASSEESPWTMGSMAA